MVNAPPAKPAGPDSLEHYAALVRALLPRITAISIYDVSGALLWTSETTQDGQLDALVEQLLATRDATDEASGQVLTLDSAEPVYIFWMRRDEESGKPFALIVLRNRRAEDGNPPTFSYVQSMARPAIECLRRELLSRLEISSLQRSLDEHDHDLSLLLAVSGGGQELQDSGSDESREMLRRASEHLGAGLATLIMPDKGLAMVERGETAPIDNSVLARTHRYLMSIAQNATGPVIHNSLSLPGAKGKENWHVLACPIRQKSGAPSGVLAFFRSHSQAPFVERQQRLAELLAQSVNTLITSNYDSLTGLLSRSAFERRLQPQLATHVSRGGWTAVYVDVNRTHVINETHGMPVGDRVLASVGELIRKLVPPGSVAARISGDRFAVLLGADLPTAESFAESLRASAEQIAAAIGQPKLQTSISVGLAPIEGRAHSYEHAFAAAESACKAANDRGRNRVELFEPEDVSIVRRFNDIGVFGDVRTALGEGRLRLVAQPIVPLNVPQAPHYEVLLRMLDRNGQTLGPDHFLSAAQRYQFMPEIDRWVIGEVLRQLKPVADLLAMTGAVFTVNFSGQSLQDTTFADSVAAMIETSGIRPASLCFELTESAAVGNVQRAEALMRRLRRLGCGIALDDFGTGMSSLAYLRTLPVSMLKIDGSFIRDVISDARAGSMVQAITHLARGMNLLTVAEYVETAAIRQRVVELGVDYGQGFEIGAPAPLEQLLESLQQQYGGNPAESARLKRAV